VGDSFPGVRETAAVRDECAHVLRAAAETVTSSPHDPSGRVETTGEFARVVCKTVSA